MPISSVLKASRSFGSCGSILNQPQVKVLRTMEEVERLRGFWSSCSGTLDSDIDVFFAGYRDAPNPRVLVLSRGENPVALLAGRIIRRRFVFKVGWLPLFKPMVNVFTVPCGGVRGDASPENCELLVRALLRCLKDGGADLAFFRCVDAESALFRCLKREPSYLLRDQFASVRTHRKRGLSASVEQFYSELSYNERQHHRKLARRLSRRFSGEVRIDLFADPAELDRALGLAEDVARKAWQRPFRKGFSIGDIVLVQSLRAQAERGWLQIRILSLGNVPCAFSIGSLYGGTFYHLYMGYAQDYVEHSPGMYLLVRLMEDLCTEGVREIDFGPSDEEFKRRLGNSSVQQVDLHVFSRSAKGLALSGMSAATNLLRGLARAIVERAGLIQTVKREWRKVSMRRAKARESRGSKQATKGRSNELG